MKSFAERNPVVVGLVGVALTGVVVLVALNYNNLPFVNSQKQYSAYFSEAGGLAPGEAVQVSGYEVGRVSSVSLEGSHVLVKFKVDDSAHLGDRTEAAVKTKSLLGSRILEVVPRGDGELSTPIPIERTTPPYQLSDALGDLATTVDHLDTGVLSQSLDTLAQTFAKTPPDLQSAVRGLSRFSQSLNHRDAQLRNLLSNANKSTKVLAERSDQVVTLITQTNALLAQLRTESACPRPGFGQSVASLKTAVGLCGRESRAIQTLGGQAQRGADHRRQPQGAVTGRDQATELLRDVTR